MADFQNIRPQLTEDIGENNCPTVSSREMASSGIQASLDRAARLLIVDREKGCGDNTYIGKAVAITDTLDSVMPKTDGGSWYEDANKRAGLFDIHS